MNSIEYIAEQFFIELFASNSKLTGLQFRHDEEDADVPDDAVIVSAEISGKQLGGPKPDEVNVTVEYRTTTGSKFNHRLVEGQIRHTIDTSTDPDGLWILRENVTSSRTRDGKIRGLEIAVPILLQAQTLV